MGKRYVQRLVLIWLAFLLTGYPRVVRAQDDGENLPEVRVDQVTVNMPDLKVYYYEGDADPGKQGIDAAVLGGEPLLLGETYAYAENRTGISYYVMLDISSSINPDYFAGIKKAILDFQTSRSANDRVTLLTFGDQVKLIYGQKTAVDDCSGQVNGLENTDETTALYQAIEKTAELTEQGEQEQQRKIAVVITDGEDFSENKSTNREALQKLTEKGIPLYSLLCSAYYGDKTNENIDAFGRFTRSSGGEQYTFEPDTAYARLEEMANILDSAKIQELSAKTNRVTGKTLSLLLSFKNGSKDTVKLKPVLYKADETAPTVRVQKTGADELELTFSEPVIHADEIKNYQVERDGHTRVDISSVQAGDTEKGVTVVLHLREKLVNGKYALSYQNISDDSMEENPLSQKSELEITDGVKADGAFTAFLKGHWLALFLAFLLVLILACVLFIYAKIKKNKGLILVDGKMTFGVNAREKLHIRLQQKAERKLFFILPAEKGKKQTMEMSIADRLVVGRARSCDIYFDDIQMSRQHFAIEGGGGYSFFIEDLHTTNGTWVNGVRVITKRKLEKNDKIQAGSVEMRIGW